MNFEILKLGEVSFGILKLGASGEMSFVMLKLGELGHNFCQISTTV